MPTFYFILLYVTVLYFYFLDIVLDIYYYYFAMKVLGVEFRAALCKTVRSTVAAQPTVDRDGGMLTL